MWNSLSLYNARKKQQQQFYRISDYIIYKKKNIWKKSEFCLFSSIVYWIKLETIKAIKNNNQDQHNFILEALKREEFCNHVT